MRDENAAESLRRQVRLRGTINRDAMLAKRHGGTCRCIIPMARRSKRDDDAVRARRWRFNAARRAEVKVA